MVRIGIIRADPDGRGHVEYFARSSRSKVAAINPHPNLEIANVDLVYGPDCPGVPAVLEITAATSP